MSEQNELTKYQKAIIVFNAMPIPLNACEYFSQHSGNGSPAQVIWILIHSVLIWLAWCKIL